jgi:hypothetical protein
MAWTVQVFVLAMQAVFFSHARPIETNSQFSYWISLVSAFQTGWEYSELMFMGKSWLNVKVAIYGDLSLPLLTSAMFLVT